MILTSMKGDITVITLSDVPLEGMENFSALITATNPSVTVFNPRAMVTIIEEGDVQHFRVPDKCVTQLSGLLTLHCYAHCNIEHLFR